MKLHARKFFALLLFGAALAAACSGAPQASPTPEGPIGDPAVGQTKYTGTCSACHGPNAAGIAGLGKDLTTSAFAKGMTDRDLAAFVMKGREAGDPLNTTGIVMPPKGGNPALTEQDILDIVAYLRTLEK